MSQETVRLIVHTVAAMVWTGVYAIAIADAPNRARTAIGWIAYASLVATGMWAAFDAQVASATPIVQGILLSKITIAIGSGVAGAVAMIAGGERSRQRAAGVAVALALVSALLGTQLVSAM